MRARWHLPCRPRLRTTKGPRPGPRGVGRVGIASDWLRGSRGGLFAIALAVGAGSGLGAVGFRYLIYFFTWVATGHVQFGQQGRVPSTHFPWLGLGFFVVIPVVGGLLYGPLIYRFAREARGHGVPEVMIAVAENGGRIRPQVAGVRRAPPRLRTVQRGLRRAAVRRREQRPDRISRRSKVRPRLAAHTNHPHTYDP